MKDLHYIWNSKTDDSFSLMEMKFYPNNWEPEMEESKEFLQSLIDEDPEKFANCIIKTMEFETNEVVFSEPDYKEKMDSLREGLKAWAKKHNKL